MEINIEEKTIVEALRSSPGLKACILEMIDITGGKWFEELNLGDDAEEAVVEKVLLVLPGKEETKYRPRRVKSLHTIHRKKTWTI